MSKPIGRHRKNVPENGWRARGDGRSGRLSGRIQSGSEEAFNFSLIYIWGKKELAKGQGTTAADSRRMVVWEVLRAARS